MALSIFVSTGMAQDQEDKWFDMENCGFCQVFAAQEGLMEHMQWEIHELENGFLNVTIVPDEMEDVWSDIEEGMQKAAMKMQEGGEAKLCQHCTAYGEFVTSGCSMQELNTIGGRIAIVTSDDPDMIAKLKKHARKTREAWKAMREHMEHGEHAESDGEKSIIMH